jgi:hypothetical protein
METLLLVSASEFSRHALVARYHMSNQVLRDIRSIREL